MRKKKRPEGLLWAYWLERQKQQPDKPVLIDAVKDASWTANGLTEASFQFSDHLLRYDAGERIAFRLPKGREWFALFLALQRAGLAGVPLDGGMRAEGCMETARRLGARAVYLDGEFQSLRKVPARHKK